MKALIVCAVFMLAPVVQAASVWKVENDQGRKIYLGGTFHLLAKSDHPLPQAFDRAFDDSQSLYFETDILGSQSLAFQAKMMRVMTFQDGRRIKDVLSEDTYAELTQFLQERSLPLEMYQSYNAVGIALVLSLLEMQRMGMSPMFGVDLTYYKKALKADKPVHSLETLDQQLAFIAGMGAGSDEDTVKYTLRDLKNISEHLNGMRTAWRSGDLSGLAGLTLTEMRRDYPDMYKTILLDRNNAWMPQVEAMFEDADTEFVLVGALHLAGEEGLVHQLGQRGYKIEKL